MINSQTNHVQNEPAAAEPTAAEACGLYRCDERILSFGDGDLSHPLALARSFGSGENLTATTLDDVDFLQTHYPDIAGTLHSLRASGARVFHGIDATKSDCYDAVLDGVPLPDKIAFHFPHPGWPEDAVRLRIHESSKIMRERHRELLRGFFENTKAMLERRGRPALEVHVTHNTSKNGVDMWHVVALGKAAGFEHVGSHPFDVESYRARGYTNKRGTTRFPLSGKWRVNRSFPLNRPVTDVFRLLRLA